MRYGLAVTRGVVPCLDIATAGESRAGGLAIVFVEYIERVGDFLSQACQE